MAEEKISEALCKLCLHFICRIVFVFMAFTIVYKFCGDVNCYIRNIFVHSCVNVCVEAKKEETCLNANFLKYLSDVWDLWTLLSLKKIVKKNSRSHFYSFRNWYYTKIEQLHCIKKFLHYQLVEFHQVYLEYYLVY